MFTVSFNKGIKIKFGLPSVNKSWLTSYHMQNSSCPRNTKLITYNPLEDFLKKFYQCFPEVSMSFSKFLTQWFPGGHFKKIQTPRPHPKLLVSRNSKLPYEEVIPKYSCPPHIHFGHGAIFPS